MLAPLLSGRAASYMEAPPPLLDAEGRRWGPSRVLASLVSRPCLPSHSGLQGSLSPAFLFFQLEHGPWPQPRRTEVILSPQRSDSRWVSGLQGPTEEEQSKAAQGEGAPGFAV